MESNETELKFLYLAFDLIILDIAISLLFYINPILWELSVHDQGLYYLHANLSWIVTYSFFSKKNLYLHDEFSNRVKRISKRMPVFILISMSLAQSILPQNFSYLFLLECGLVFFMGKMIFYFLLYRYLKYRRAKGYYTHKVMIIGVNDMSLFLRDLLNNNPMLGYDFVGYVSEDHEKRKVGKVGTEVLGGLDHLETLVSQYEVDLLFVTNSAYNDLKKTKELLAVCNKIGVRLRFVPENQYWFKSNKNMETVGSLVIFNPQEIPLDNLKLRFAKRAFDVIFSSFVILFVCSWLFPILFVLIRLNSKGPLFFLQERTGINNKTFKCMKFRSMTVNADANEKQATQGDSRITSVGRFLRKSNLDEFPQFFNVLLGQMSVVGPRPHMLKHTMQYSELIDYYRVRHYVKPGITGWAQVNGYRGETDELWKMEKRVEYDMYYLENWNFWWDIRIVFMTLFGKKVRMNAF
ncbi:MAG: undecaprenyl-phosphate glucose phosphotransferase [Paludibacter sp.]